MRAYEYVVVDVFTSERFAGNQLAVIPDASEMSTAQMQAITREFGYSETTFVTAPNRPENDAQVRIFTPASEIPFAGHPNVGTAYVLGRAGVVFGKAVRDALRFEERAGLVEVDLRRVGDTVGGAQVRAPQSLTRFGTIAPGDAAACAGLAVEDVALERHEPTIAGVGLPFLLVELGDVAALSRAKPDLAAFERTAANAPPIVEEMGRLSMFLYARAEPSSPDDGRRRLRARMFAPLGGIWEDPATGSASAALGAHLADLQAAGGGEARLEAVIEQGVEMGRRSVIEVSAEVGGPTRIAGDCVETMRGRITL